MTKSNPIAFTIVELIVVITILAILGTIGFISFSSHLVGTRDTNRLSQLSTIYEGLEVYSANNNLPNPENNVEVRASGSLIGYQGYAGKNVLGMIGYSKGGKDPRDELYYSYYLTQDKKHFQLMGFLEDESNKQVSLITKTNATDYTRRYPTVIGKKLGILTESGTNSPIQEVSTIVSSGYLDVVNTTKDYKANFTDQDSISGSGGKLILLKNIPLNSLDYDASLVGYWDMETTINLKLKDLTNNGNDGTNNGSLIIGENDGKKGKSTSFNGTNQYISSSTNSGIISFTDNFTLSAWIYPKSYHTIGYFGLKNIFISKGPAGTFNYALQVTNDNTISFIERTGLEGLQYTNFTGINSMINHWVFITLIVKNNTIYLYIDGKLFESKTVGIIGPGVNDSFNIGGFGGGTGYETEPYFSGIIDEIRIYNRALSASEVQGLYNSIK